MNQITISSLDETEFKQLLVSTITEVLRPVLHQIQNPATPEKEFLTRHETAQRLNISLGTLHTQTTKGKIQSHKIGRRILYTPESIQNAIQKRVFRANVVEGVHNATN